MRKHLGPCLFFFLLALLYFYKQIFLGQVSFADDLSYFSYFEKSFFSKEILEGRFPFWNPHIFGGIPYLADVNRGALYPPNILFVFLPFASALTTHLFLHLWLAGMAAYLWGKRLSLSTTAALAVGSLYVLSGVFATENIHVGYFAALSWAPLAFYFAQDWVEKKDIFPSVLIGLVLTLQMLSGSPQFLLITGYSLLFYIFVQSFRVQDVPVLVGGILLGLAVSAAQWLPSFEFIRECSRPHPLGYEFATSFHLPVRELLSEPFRFDSHGRTGFLALFLAMVAVVLVRDRKVFCLFFLTLATTLLSLGKEGFLFRMAYEFLPGFSLFRAPYRFIFFSVLFISVLAGVGLERILKGRPWRPAYSAGIIVILILEVTQGFQSLGGIYPVANSDFYRFRAEQPFIDFLRQRNGTFRILMLEGEVPCQEYPVGSGGYFPLSPNFGEKYGFENMDGYQPFRLRRYNELRRTLPFGMFMFLLNTRYWVTPQDFGHPQWCKQIYQNDSVRIYEMENVAPRYFIVSKARSFQNENGVLTFMQSPAFRPTEEVALLEEESYPSLETDSAVARYRMALMKRTADEAILAVSTQRAGILVCSEPYYPGWKARVNGIEVPLLRANYLFRAIALTPGEHIIRFYFDPFTFRTGYFISLVASLAILILMFKRRSGDYGHRPVSSAC